MSSPKWEGENAQELGGQGDLGHQHHGGTAPGQCLIDQPEIHLGLAAARHPVQQGGSGSSDRRQGVQSLKGRLLLGVEHRGSGPLPASTVTRRNTSRCSRRRIPLFSKERRVALAAPGEVTQLLSRGAAEGAQQLGHGIPQGRGAAPWRDQGHGLLGGWPARPPALSCPPPPGRRWFPR